jgi:putative ABC transport system permease protein
MTILRRWLAAIAGAWRGERSEQGLDAELRAYVDLSAADKERAGLSPGEARRQALIELGGIEAVKEQVRRGRHGGAIEEIWRDTRYGVRLLRRTPLFSAVVVLTLALAIGANATVFSVVDALLLRSLPVRAPDELVTVSLQRRDATADGGAVGTLSYRMVRLFAEQLDLFAAAGAYSAFRFDVGAADAVVRVPGAVVTGGFFVALGIEPQVGRLLQPADDAPGAPAVAVISDGFWERRFSRRRDAVGQSLLVGGTSVPIVGVAPRGFAGATVGSPADVTIAAAALPQVSPDQAPLLEPGNFWLRVVARPRPGLSREHLTARLEAVWRRSADGVIAPHWPARRRADVAALVPRLAPGGSGSTYLRQIYRAPLIVLLGIVGTVLLIACANLAGLLLTRAASRQRELALRLALGAGRWRVVRQLLAEGAVLAVAGAALGTALAAAASRVLVALMSTSQLPIAIDVGPDLRVLAFVTAVAGGTTLLFAVVPALVATAIDPRQELATGGRASRSRARWLAALVSGQVALALVLLAGAGLFIRTFDNLRRFDSGFDAEGVLVAELQPRHAHDSTVVPALADLPGVTAVSLATHTPLDGWTWTEAVVPAGQPLPERESTVAIGIGPGYFDTLGLRLLGGRAFGASDAAGGAPVAIVNEAYARRHFSRVDVVGARLASRVGGRPHELTVLGVAANTPLSGFRVDPPPTIYLPIAQLPEVIRVTVLVRGVGGPASLARTIEPTLRAAQPGVAVEIAPLASQVGASIAQERILALLGGGFGLMALLLSTMGLHALIAYGVAQRTHELGVRVALGARGPQILRLVVGEGAWLVAIGVAAGIPAAWLASRWVRTLLFGVTPADPVVAASAVAVLTTAAIVAAWVPARRAARTDPLTALRHE